MPEPVKSELIKLKVRYGFDPEGNGEAFFWPESPTKRKESQAVRRASPAEFESVYQCAPGQREGSIFLEKDFCYYDQPLGLHLGIQANDVRKFCSGGHAIFQAWDTAFSATSESAYTAGITGLFLPCSQYHCQEDPKIMGDCESHFDVIILDVFREKLEAGDLGGKGLISAVRTQHMKWLPELVIIEKKASGIGLVQTLPSMNIPVLGVSAQEGKRARAIRTIDGAGSAQGWFKLHRVLFPKYAAWLQPLKTELKDFTGDESATTDQVDAIVHLIVHAIQIGSKMAMLPTGWSPDRTEPMAAMDAIRDANLEPMDDRAAFLATLGELPIMSTDPFESTCSHCMNFSNSFCKLHQRKVTAFDLCTEFRSRDIKDPSNYTESYSEVYQQ